MHMKTVFSAHLYQHYLYFNRTLIKAENIKEPRRKKNRVEIVTIGRMTVCGSVSSQWRA